MTHEHIQTHDTVILALTRTIVSDYVAHNSLPRSSLGGLIMNVHAALARLRKDTLRAPAVKLTPAVPIRHSVTLDYIVCLEDGKKFKSLKSHLSTHAGLTPDEYRAKWGLPPDYPMVAPRYAAVRSMLAKRVGLGRKRDKQGDVSGSLRSRSRRKRMPS